MEKKNTNDFEKLLPVTLMVTFDTIPGWKIFFLHRRNSKWYLGGLYTSRISKN